MINKCRAYWIIIFVVLAGMASGLNAQYLETHPMRGFMPNMEQLSSPVDNIDAANGKLKLQIPLASLPRGKGGTGFDLNLEYDSRIYDLEQHAESSNCSGNTQYGPYKYAYLTSQTSTGGWNYNVNNYRIEGEYKPLINAATDGAVGCNYNDALAVRFRVYLPDGSGHILHLKGYELRDETYSGYNTIYTTGQKVNFCARLWDGINYGDWLYYYTNDGSYLRLEVYNGSDPSIPWYTLYLPDGSRIVGDYGNYVKYDANGNYLHVYTTMDAIKHTHIEDNAGNALIIDYGAEVAGGRTRDIIHVKGPNSDDVQYAVDWQTIMIGGPQGSANHRTYLYAVHPCEGGKWGDVYFHFKVVQYVHLPKAQGDSNLFPPLTQAPQTSDSYEFRYWGNAQDPEDTEPSFEPGYGMLNYMRMPSGSRYRYYYTLGKPDQLYPFLAAAISSKTYISKKKLIYADPNTGDDTTLVWQFAMDDFTTTITNPDGGKIKYSYDTKGVGNWDSDLVYLIEELDATGAPKGKEISRSWSFNRPYGLRNVRHIANNNYMGVEIVSIRNAAGVLTKSARTDFVYDTNGNLRTKTEYDWAAYEATTAGVIKRRTENNYYAVTQDTGNYAIEDDPDAYWNSGAAGMPRRLNAVKRQTVYEGASTAKAATEYVYDDPYTKGNVIKEIRWDSARLASLPALGTLPTLPLNTSLVSSFAYDSYGNLKDKIEGGVKTHITYDANASLVIRVDTAYGTTAQRSMGYEWKNGVALWKKKDLQNNLITEYVYDNVGRQIAVMDKNSSGNLLRTTTTEYDDVARQVTVRSDLRTQNDQLLESRTYYDPVGRVYRTQQSDETPLTGTSDGIKTNTYYIHAAGGKRVVSSSPYRQLSDATLEWSCTQHDVWNRVTAVAMYKGSMPPADCASTANRTGMTTTVYDTDDKGSVTKVTDPAGRARTQSADALGRLVRVIEDPGSSPHLNYRTEYTYDGLGNLAQVLQGGQTRTFIYSSLGRLLSANNPESGNIQYAYYDNGDLYRKTDARGIITTIVYDPLHRILMKDYSDSTPDVTYDYYLAGNAATPNIGRLRSVSSSAGSTLYTYTQSGKVAASAHSITGLAGAATIAYDYYANGSLKSERYPSGRVVYYDVDNAGRTNRTYTENETYVNAAGAAATMFTADGRLKQALLGNGLWETRNYQAPGTATEYMLGTTQGSFNVTMLSYSFSGSQNNGNVISQTMMRNGSSSWTQTYGYDNVNRLLSINETTGIPWSQTYGYDRYGNRYIRSSSGIGTETHEPVALSQFNAANNRLTMTGITYDEAGNQTYYAPFTLSYDGESRNTEVKTSDNIYATYSYDGDGRRVKKEIPGGATTYFVYDAMGQMIVEYSTQAPVHIGTSYMFTDMLGSVRTITDQNGAVVENYDYLPFGRLLGSSQNGRANLNFPNNPDEPAINPSSRTPQKFTGKERDSETGLDYFGARYMSSAQGRFMIPDPSSSGIAPADPQSWNVYSYVRNRPTGSLDIDGNWTTSIHKQIVAYALQDYVSAKELQILQSQQDVMDGQHNQDNDQYMHAMSNGNSTPPQTAADARSKMDIFLAWKFREVKANINKDGSFSNASLGHLGDAIHTLQDTTSRVHMTSSGSPLPWKGKTNGGYAHLVGENELRDSWGGMGLAIRKTMDAFMKANPDLAAKRGLTKDTFDKEANKMINRMIDFQWYEYGFAGSEKAREEARQCALTGGEGAACVQ